MSKSNAHIISIFIGKSNEPLRTVASAIATPGIGLGGDRYSDGTGTFFKPNCPDREITLIEIESFEALQRDYDVELAPASARRNLLTRAVSLNHLVGRTFKVGAVTLEGLRLCEPCKHLAGLTSERVRQGLVHRGGLRARIVVSGEIRAGDPIEVHVTR
jgi:MOSC domain-containing protein YiiM